MRTDLILLIIDAVGLKSCSLKRSYGMNLNADIPLGSSVNKSNSTKQAGLAEMSVQYESSI
jgi:hypothetical protein